MLLRAFAKINLDLRILGRRPDGYHELATVLQTIDFADEIRIEPFGRLEFVSHGVEGGEGNLVVRAVRAFEGLTGRTVQARIELFKNIPAGAGLGGGSADAAVTFLGLERLLGVAVPDEDRREALGRIGADVPFFTAGGRVLGTGRGDLLTPLEDVADFWAVLLYPGFPIATAQAYSWLTVSDKAISIEGFDTHSFPGLGTEQPGNDFERAVFARHPVLSDIKSRLLIAGASTALLSGSGSSVFGIFESRTAASEAAERLQGVAEQGIIRVTRSLSRAEYARKIFDRAS